MSNYTTLKTTINANIRQNGNQEITGKILNSVLNEMVNTLGEGYQFAGIAIMETDPGTPDAKVFYIANGKGTYTNFGGLEVTEDEVVFLVWDKSWHKVATGIAADAKLKEAVKELTEIAGKVDTKQDIIPDLEAIREGAGKGNEASSTIASIVEAGYVFAGIATPETNPGTPDTKVFYIAKGKGTYTSFSGIEVTEDEVVALCWDSLWNKISTGIASDQKLSELGKEIATKQDIIPDLDSIRSGAALGASALQKETDPNVPSWAKASTKPSYTPAEIGAASEESLQIHENDNIRHITASERTKWNEKQDALTLTVKDNGNIVIGNIQGQTKEFMPATPSGDPMHYAYVAAGAGWNGTGADIVKTTPWADLADDDADKTVVHKAGYWYLNGLGDITNDEIRRIYQLTSAYPETTNLAERFRGFKIRTNFNKEGEVGGYVEVNTLAMLISSSLVVVRGPLVSIRESDWMFYGSRVRHYVDKLNILKSRYGISSDYLITIRLFNLKIDIKIDCPHLSVKSVLYAINNEKATSPITITLHPDAYARAMADADILAALEQHTNISLASA